MEAIKTNDEATHPVMVKFTDPDTYKTRFHFVDTVEEAKRFLDTNWRISFATITNI